MRMHIRWGAGLVAAIVTVASPPVVAQAIDSSPIAKAIDKLLGGGPRWASVTTFSVAGVRLGMTVDEARAALKAAGFSAQAVDPTQDAWAALVSRRAAERAGGAVDQSKVPMFTMASGPQGEHVEVWYAAAPDGARVTEVKYQMPTGRMDRAAFLGGAVGRYGRPTVQEPSRGLYCSRGEPTCQTYANKALPYLTTETGGATHDIEIRMGERYREDLKARMAAAVEAAAPKNAKASF